MYNYINYLTAGLIILLTGHLAGCATDSSIESVSAATPTMEIYEVHHEGRIHIFYDKKLYKEFLSLGETPFRLTRIGAGPNGETLVFGLTKKDKKMKSSIPVIDLYDGKIKQDSVYAEMHKHERIYVFSSFKDMGTVRSFGHPNYMYTQIGAGPKGETVVFVLNKHNKKKRPDALIAEYKKHNS
jgi:hypothetical protein